MLTVFSWTWILIGLLGLWVSGQHYYGWLIGAFYQILWTIYMYEIEQYALMVQGLIFLVVFFRNYYVGRKTLTSGKEQSIIEP